MGRYYNRALKHLAEGRIEQALTDFISGVEHSDDKCAFGILRIATEIGSNTFREEEAIAIFQHHLDAILGMAQRGDAEAMVMVAEAIRRGFTERDDEPYLYWLNRAAELGSADATHILGELEREQSSEHLRLAPPGAVVTAEGSYSLPIPDDGLDFDEHVLIGDADCDLLDTLGVFDSW